MSSIIAILLILVKIPMYNTTYSLIPFKSHLREFIREKLPVSEVKPLPLNTFGKTYLTIALKRSGQHAIINWLCHHLKSAIHMNDCISNSQTNKVH